MGRKRLANKDLPRYMTLEHGAYFYRTPDRRRVRLGTELETALRAYKQHAGRDGIKYVPSNLASVLLKRARDSARVREIEFALTLEHVKHLVAMCNRRCSVSGLELDAIADGRYALNPWAPSLDRVDSTRGYVDGNCRIVCLAVNMALNEWGVDVLHAVVEGVQRVRGIPLIRLARVRDTATALRDIHPAAGL
jgi:hypothetical protein